MVDWFLEASLNSMAEIPGVRSDAEEGEVEGEGKGLSASFVLCNIG